MVDIKNVGKWELKKNCYMRKKYFLPFYLHTSKYFLGLSESGSHFLSGTWVIR